MAAKKPVEKIDNAGPDFNPFAPELDQVSPEFDFNTLVEGYKAKLQESDKRKIGIHDRIKKNQDAIARINNLIEQLILKSHQESGTVWISTVIRPISAEIQKVFPNANVEVSPMNNAAMITVSKKGIKPADKMKGVDCRSVTLCQHEQGIGLRDFSRSTDEYPAGSLGALAGLNFPVVPIAGDRIIPTLVEFILK